MKELSKMRQVKNLDEKLLIRFNKELEDKSFKEFVEKLGFSYEFLAKYTTLLLQSKEECETCKNCKSLLACKNKITGYAYLPVKKNNTLEFKYQMCKYKKEILEKEEFLKNVYSFKVPEELQKADFKQVDKTDEKRHDVIKYLLNFIKDYQDKKSPKGLYLHGNFGCGKTYLVCAMLNELAKKGYKSAIVFWPEYLRLLKSTFNDNDEFKNNFLKVKEAPILLIDDIGAENLTSWARDEILCTILQYRMDENLPTFFTSNLDIAALEKHLSITKDGVSEIKSGRIISRINQLTNDYEMISKNLRK